VQDLGQAGAQGDRLGGAQPQRVGAKASPLALIASAEAAPGEGQQLGLQVRGDDG
jgi:hypothetical protein